jgi:hypothetical protein
LRNLHTFAAQKSHKKSNSLSKNQKGLRTPRYQEATQAKKSAKSPRARFIHQMAAVATGFRISETNTWATKVPLPSCKDDETQSRTPMAIHFVINNSQSKGNMTREVVAAFSSLVDRDQALFANALRM